MLNELFELSQSMRGIETEVPSRDLVECRTSGSTIRVFLDHTGCISRLEPETDRERLRKTLKYFKGENGVSFPAFNVPPLYEHKSGEVSGLLKRITKISANGGYLEKETFEAELLSLCQSSKKSWSPNKAEQIDKCVKSLAKELESIIRPIPVEFCALAELCHRAELLDANSLHSHLTEALIKAAFDDAGHAKFWIDRLFSSSGKQAQDFQVILEIPDWKDYPASHEKVQVWLRKKLFERSSGLENTHMVDAFGKPTMGTDQKLPTVRLSVLVDVRLRAMSDESPCQFRYGRAESRSFPIGQASRDEMERSLRWLGDPIRKGKTWQDVSDACGYDRGMLFVYPSELLLDPPELAGLFATEETGEKGGAKFEASAARVTPALEGIVRTHPDAQIRVFVLAKPDGYRTKVLVSRNYDARHIITAAQAWQEGCRNIPLVSLNIGTRDKPTWIAPLILFPAEAVKCLNTVWLQSGTRTKPVHRLGMGDGIGLLMETGQKSRAIVNHALQLAVYNVAPLLLALGQADHKRDGSFGWNKDTAKYAKHASLLPSLLGLLLYKLNYTKGGYMSSAPFLVGQMLALADTIHKEYCQHVRKGEVPPQLIGNALMPAALDNPTAGLARLSGRIVPYQAWANTAAGDSVGLAKWTLQRFRDVAEELGKQMLPEQCNDADKAQMLLGYLARLEAGASDKRAN